MDSLSALLGPRLKRDYLERAVLHSAYRKSTAWPGQNRSLTLELTASPTLKLSSTSLLGWMLPWKVRVGNASWTTFDPALPRAIRALVGAHLADGDDFWRREYWAHEDWLRRQLRASLRHELSGDYERWLVDYALVAKRFWVEESRFLVNRDESRDWELSWVALDASEGFCQHRVDCAVS